MLILPAKYGYGGVAKACENENDRWAIKGGGYFIAITQSSAIHSLVFRCSQIHCVVVVQLPPNLQFVAVRDYTLDNSLFPIPCINA